LVLTQTDLKIMFVITDLTVVHSFYCLIIIIFLLSFKKTLISKLLSCLVTFSPNNSTKIIKISETLLCRAQAWRTSR
jgi:hypothetical protein